MPPIVTLTGFTGRSTAYQTFGFDARWTHSPGCYAFLAGVLQNRYVRTSASQILYIGQTNSFQRRMSEQSDTVWLNALSLGATHVLARTIPNEEERLAEEQDLIGRYQPQLNTQHIGQLNPLFRYWQS